MNRRWTDAVPAALICAITILTYGVLITRLGFYRDDWYLFSTAQSEGTRGIIALFQIDRPLIGYFYAVAYKLLGMAPLAWQVAALFMRLLGNLVFFRLLMLLWPGRMRESLLISLLFSVYPGFTVQPNAGVYISDLTANAAALLSILLMVAAFRSSRRVVSILFVALSLVLEIFYLGMFEAAIGLEVARLGILAYLVWRDELGPTRLVLRSVVRWASPFLVVSIGFLVWRLFIFQSTRRATNLGVLIGKYGALPIRSSFALVVETAKDLVETAVLAWFVPFYQNVAQANYRDLAIAVAVAALAIVLLWLAGRSSMASAQEAPDESYAPQHAIWLGLLLLTFGILPIDLAGRNVLFSSQWDRYTIYASAGVALLVGGCLLQFLRVRPQGFVLAGLLAMSVIVHYFSAASYRDFWYWQQDLWQQMVWRAPSIERGTMLFASLPFGTYEEGYEIYGAANMVYYPGEGVQLGGDVLNRDTVADLQLGKDRQHYDRGVLVADNYSHALIAVYPQSDSCLHVLDGRKVELPGFIEDSLVADAAAYSRLEQIETTASPAVLPTFMDGERPRPWCRYYQRMDLARQEGEWQEVARLADEAQARGLTPEDVSEWMPALEAYATLGRTADARHAASIIRSSDAARAFLCLQMQRGPAYPPPYDYNGVNQFLCQAN